MRTPSTLRPFDPSTSSGLRTQDSGRPFDRLRVSGLTLAAACSLLFGSQAFAANKLRLERIDKNDMPAVKFYLTFVDTDGQVITGKIKDDFKLILDSAEQGAASATVTFDQSPARVTAAKAAENKASDKKDFEKVNVVAVVQISGVMTEVIDELKKGVRNLADAIPPSSKMALLGYSADTKRLAEMGPPGEADSAANTMAIDNEGSEVHLLDAVRTAIDLLNSAPKDERKLLVLFSDGINIDMEKKSFVSIGRRASEAGVVIDTIGYSPYEPGKLKNLSELAKQTNGSHRTCTSSSTVNTQFGAVADEIKKQYVVTFLMAVKGGPGTPAHSFQVVGGDATSAAYSNTLNDTLPKGGELPPPPGSRNWLWWTLGGVLGLALLVLVVWLIIRWRANRPEPEEEAAPIEQPVVATAAPVKMKTVALDIGGDGKTLVVGWIVGMGGKHVDQTFKLKASRTLIGTAAGCDVMIEDTFMSTQHCEVRLDGTNFRLVDLGSTNGIMVNNKRVYEHELVDNDTFKLGRTDFKFKSIS